MAIHEGLSYPQYASLAGIRASDINDHKRHLKKNFVDENHESYFDVGKTFHAMMRGNDFLEKEVMIICHNDFRTKQAQNEKKFAYETGKTPILERDYQALCKLAESGRYALNEEGFFDEECKSELVITQRADTDAEIVDVKCMIDRINVKSKRIIDYKTCDKIRFLNPSDFESQAIHYRTITAMEYRIAPSEVLFTYFFIEKKPPYPFQLVEVQFKPEHLADWFTTLNEIKTFKDKTKLYPEVPAFYEKRSW